jgi:hypothetical protein
MTPGFCVSTDAGREYIGEVQAASTKRAHTEEAYLNATRRYESLWMQVARLNSPEALRAFEESESLKVSKIANDHARRDDEYRSRLKVLREQYDGRVLAVHYEPILGDVKWWRPLNREYRVFKRLGLGEFERVREETSGRGN